MLKARKKMTKKELKTDPFFERMDALLRFYKRNEKRIWTILIVVILIGIAGSYITRSTIKKQEKAKSQISIAQFYMKSGQEDRAISLLSEVRDGLYGKKYIGYAAYYLGDIYLKNRNYDQAEENYREFLRSNSGDRLMKATAWAALGAVEESRDAYEKASEFYLEALKLAELTNRKMNFGEKAFQNALKAGNIQRAEHVLLLLEKLDLNEIQKNKIVSYRILLEK
ncbi:MAG: Tetratricopeptide repeat-like domain [Candidatus Marinimicrobia bacterium]|nr:Tetratricopeptide repeat-like domain [Candidatus Neomarinimicrobiota bacterium]